MSTGPKKRMRARHRAVRPGAHPDVLQAGLRLAGLHKTFSITRSWAPNVCTRVDATVLTYCRIRAVSVAVRRLGCRNAATLRCVMCRVMAAASSKLRSLRRDFRVHRHRKCLAEACEGTVIFEAHEARSAPTRFCQQRRSHLQGRMERYGSAAETETKACRRNGLSQNGSGPFWGNSFASKWRMASKKHENGANRICVKMKSGQTIPSHMGQNSYPDPQSEHGKGCSRTQAPRVHALTSCCFHSKACPGASGRGTISRPKTTYPASIRRLSFLMSAKGAV